jgi:hypothetical protein
MANLLSGSKLRSGGSGEFLILSNAQPQLPTTVSSSTGFTLVTNNLLQTVYASSLGNIEFNQSRMYSNQSTGTITILATGTVSVSTSTATGTLVVQGGVGIGRNLWVKEDIHVNDITFGKGYMGKNNIAITGTADTTNGYTPGEENIVIGYNALQSLSTARRSIAIGSYSFSTGTNIAESIAIGNRSMENLGKIHSLPIGSITSATNENPVVITVAGHNLQTGTNVLIQHVQGMIELNDLEYYVKIISPSRLALYTNLLVTTPVNGTGYNTYTTGGDLSKVVSSNNNFALGNDTAPALIDGEYNFFIGNRTARDLTTGSNNFFLGNDVGNNVTNASGIIAIGSELIVDGVDNQIGIGGVIYSDGNGLVTFYSDARVGQGQDAISTNTGALTVIGGIGATGNIYSNSGNPDEDFLLYSPKVYVVATYPPLNPKIGDVWIDTVASTYNTYIYDGTSAYWLQVTQI